MMTSISSARSQRTSRGFILFAIVLGACVFLFTSTFVRAHPSGPDPGVTGGFGEPTCNQRGCHVDFKLNAGREAGLGDLVLTGLPKEYEPGKTYPMMLAVTHTQDRSSWGFQLAARDAKTGVQAGELKPTDGSTQVLSANGIQYIEHTLDGIGSNTFNFNWVAPSTPAGEVMMNAAGNAADGDFFPSGDYIYSSSFSVSPVK